MTRRVAVAVGMIALAALLPAQVGGLFPGRPFAERKFGPNVPQLLVRAIRAQPTLRYKGTYTVEFDTGAKVPRHQEYITRAGSWYRIDFPSDSPFAGQVIVENEMMRLHYHPIPNEIVQQPPRHGEAWDKVANLVNNKKLVLTTTAGDVVAGMKTEQIVVSDKAGNISLRLFIEPNSGLILKRQLFDLVGTQVGFFQFDKVDLSPKIDPSAFVIKRKGAKYITPKTQLERVCRRRGFAVHFLPPTSGYSLEGANYKQFAGVDGLVETYLNGTQRLWVYVLKAPVDLERLRNGAGKNLHFYSFESNGETIVLLAILDDATLSRLGGMIAGGTLPLRH